MLPMFFKNHVIYSCNQYCSQLISTTTFISQQTKRKFKIYHIVNCESEYVIYLMECTLCNKQYVGKTETAFNIRLNIHRKDTKDPNTMLACRHFQQQGHNFHSHAKYIIIDKLVNASSSTDILRECLIQLENFWIQQLKILAPYGLNKKFNKYKKEDLHAAFLRSFLPRTQQSHHLRTKMMV